MLELKKSLFFGYLTIVSAEIVSIDVLNDNDFVSTNDVAEYDAETYNSDDVREESDEVKASVISALYLNGLMNKMAIASGYDYVYMTTIDYSLMKSINDYVNNYDEYG